MSFNILRNTIIRTRPLLRTSTLTRAYQIQAHPEAYSSKNQEFFIAASFPDDFESPTLSEKRGVPTSSWDELHATLSEAAVKADRGEVKMQQLTSREELERMLQPDKMDPKIDEM
ncbi:hypothetical protein BDV38DRAFT_246756 [Aspergillus pseudotamarii]|uniref:Uncharacterized protein n=1 Tax=Aspergillus pseudotamarii TaxID=132259 RepID=A0A5N6SUJ9_ASPPS|nr:uncharacterized protein BDV38DRAFT_246756 [Aspergillus pseudotamarii]KAE8137420.1 hypothetical protein BDV38DRAFT_246756 [Aspergillus pseudotamarii]